MQSFLSGKRSSSNLENPPAKRHTKEQTDRDPEQVEDPNDDVEIEIAEEALESYTPTVEEEPTVEKSNDILSLDQGEDMKKVIKAALIDALKDTEAAKVLSEQIAVRIRNLNLNESNS